MPAVSAFEQAYQNDHLGALHASHRQQLRPRPTPRVHSHLLELTGQQLLSNIEGALVAIRPGARGGG